MKSSALLIQELKNQKKFLQKKEELNNNIEEKNEEKIIMEPSDSLLDLPPDYLPPPLTNGTTLDNSGRKFLKNIENKYKEFFEVGDRLSEKAGIAFEILNAVLSNLSKAVVDKLPDGGLSFAMFTSSINKYAENLADRKDPIPQVSAQIQKLSEMNIPDIKQTFTDLHNGITNSEYNAGFKERAIACVLLTFAYGKLLQSRKLLTNIDDEQFKLLTDMLSPSFQRLAQLGLFVEGAKECFVSLLDCSILTGEKISEYDKEIINEIIKMLDEFMVRAKLIANATNIVQNAIQLVAMDTEEKRFSEDALKQLEFFEQLVLNTVPAIMESETPEIVLEKLNQELSSKLTLESAKLYRQVLKLLDKQGLDRQNVIVELKKKLCEIHEDTMLDDSTKLLRMKNTIITIHNNLADELYSQSSFFYQPKSDLKDMLLTFVKNNYTVQIVQPHSGQTNNVQFKK